jgi:EAL domain-containing protein (putative c-di-GMP-specific phosphodiesterase class I)
LAGQDVIRAQGHDDFRVAVNLFDAQFLYGDLVSVVKAALAENDLPSHCLELEITEKIILERHEVTVFVLQQLAELGVRLSFDDYGTGYASLSLLKRFPLACLKIDQGFTRNLCSEREDTAVVKAIIYLAENFQLDVVAEGIETENQERRLREFGCQYGQGYLYAKPMPAVAFKSLFAANVSSSAQRA